MNILFLNPNRKNEKNWGHHLFKKEIGKQHNVVYYGAGYNNFDPKKSVPEIISDFKNTGKEFDFVLTYESKWVKDFKGLNKIKIPKVHIACDYVKPQEGFKNFSTWTNVDRIIKLQKPDIIFARTTKSLNDMKKNLKQDNIFFLPFSVDIDIYKNLNLEKTIDVMASFSDNPVVYPSRRKIRNAALSLGINVFYRKVIHEKYIQKINKSKIFINSNNLNNSLSMKYSEVLSCGTLFLTDKPEDFEILGYEDQKHLVLYSNTNELKEKIKYYLEHEDERQQISLEGMNFVRENHNNTIRVKQFIDIVKKELRL